MGDMSIKSNDDIKKYKLATENCDYFKRFIRDNISVRDQNDSLKDLDCYKEYKFNWLILEPDRDNLEGQEIIEELQQEQSWTQWLIGQVPFVTGIYS